MELELINIKGVIPEDKANAAYLGGKGYGLAWMQQQGVKVPPALILPTTVCVEYMKSPKGVMKKIAAKLPAIMKTFTDEFGYMPLLSVRSGARVSMPGMMDTILNVGLDKDTAGFWTNKLGEDCFENSLHRLVTMYGNVVKGIDRAGLEEAGSDGAIAYYASETGEDFPATKAQILGAIEAVFKSWNNDRAKFYRKMHDIPEDWGTAVVIQAMVFGNLNNNSGTGVLFTRNPDSGENVITGEFLVNAQGEDVVAGIRTPLPLSEISKAINPEVAGLLLTSVTKLENARKDVQDVEFTIQDGELFILQTRNAKRSAKAAVKIALDMVEEKLLTPAEAAKRVTNRELDLAQQAQIDPKFKLEADFTGIAACSGVVSGKPVFSAQAAIDCKEPCILITQETTPDDIAGMAAAVGVLTMTGGATSHAAVVARGMNKPCVVGLGEDIEQFKGLATVSIDGATGRVWSCPVPLANGKSNELVTKFLAMAVKETGVIPATDTPLPGVDAILLDLGASLYDVPKCLDKVLTALDAFDGVVYVDCLPGRDAKAEDQFNALFGTFDATPLLKALEATLTDAGKARVRVITDKETELRAFRPPFDLKSLVLSGGDIAFDKGAQIDLQDAATAQVMKWLEKDKGITPLYLGYVAPNGASVVSPQHAMLLLT